MASVVIIDIGIKHTDTGISQGRSFVINDRSLAKEALWTWMQTTINELDIEPQPDGRELVGTN